MTIPKVDFQLENYSLGGRRLSRAACWPLQATQTLVLASWHLV